MTTITKIVITMIKITTIVTIITIIAIIAITVAGGEFHLTPLCVSHGVEEVDISFSRLTTIARSSYNAVHGVVSSPKLI